MKKKKILTILYIVSFVILLITFIVAIFTKFIIPVLIVWFIMKCFQIAIMTCK